MRAYASYSKCSVCTGSPSRRVAPRTEPVNVMTAPTSGCFQERRDGIEIGCVSRNGKIGWMGHKCFRRLAVAISRRFGYQPPLNRWEQGRFITDVDACGRFGKLAVDGNE